MCLFTVIVLETSHAVSGFFKSLFGAAYSRIVRIQHVPGARFVNSHCFALQPDWYPQGLRSEPSTTSVTQNRACPLVDNTALPDDQCKSLPPADGPWKQRRAFHLMTMRASAGRHCSTASLGVSVCANQVPGPFDHRQSRLPAADSWALDFL